VGHIFQLGRKYSEAMKAAVLDPAGKPLVPLMGCYGIGVTRVVAAAIEQNHDDRGIIWPEPLAPYTVLILTLNHDRSEAVRNCAEKLYADFNAAGIDALFDDRDARPGVKFADAELIGIPHCIVVGDRGIAAGKLEYRHRRSGATGEIAIDGVIADIKARLGS
jgi:prolyl-tRNA synthetase